ncbi:hypothetical protein [Pseudonocardia alaniniphila]|uniref:Uncharacterized protein n=1 Tax=Pseudonocardia alaniniphila TaxID=75291 RepID=A0ABS9TKD5_9PSEU|nr:hypothetical protein [Pseudonocardia alaniniphila]MCH6169002.1 hypothetical protein [Pseudonocardia alaniniphila]
MITVSVRTTALGAAVGSKPMITSGRIFKIVAWGRPAVPDAVGGPGTSIMMVVHCGDRPVGWACAKIIGSEP